MREVEVEERRATKGADPSKRGMRRRLREKQTWERRKRERSVQS